MVKTDCGQVLAVRALGHGVGKPSGLRWRTAICQDNDGIACSVLAFLEDSDRE